ncbi:MAG: biosynthetic arginine decarboxylase [Pseudomonadota bacterium]|jgi:arginine decarboxylase
MNRISQAHQEVDWSAERAADLYGVDYWSAGHFQVSAAGLAQVRAEVGGEQCTVNLIDIVRGLQERGLPMPVLVRIENLLDAQIAQLNQSFARAIAQSGYRGNYRGVFPIKVNQQSQIIDEVASFGARFGHGLEAGSKAELLIALASLNVDQGYIVCNGYKDEEFINLGLMAQKLGYRIFFVVETPAELPLLIRCGQRAGIRPRMGARVKLSSQVSGHWNATSGDRSIFGLTSMQLIDLVDELKAHDMLDCMEMLHVHLGSQIPNIRDIRAGVMEACRYYVDLFREGAPLGNLDLGGGLAVDYEGSRSSRVHSMNYSLEEYCLDIVEVVMSVLDPHDIPHPTIVTESGRALVAYGSVLIFNILDVTRFEAHNLPPALGADQHENLHNLWEVMASVTFERAQECYNDALFYRDEIRDLFRRGQISLRARSLAENIYLEILQRIKSVIIGREDEYPDLAGLEEGLADIYYGNFSVFQSLPDIWAIDQVFPIMPIHRLDEVPSRQAILADITCDCDGKIDRFAWDGDLHGTLPVHPLVEGDEYYLGVFLVGAYQETLGDLHNLLGDTHVVSVRINADGSFDYVKEVEGDSVADVLSYVEYHPQTLLQKFRDSAEQGVRSGRITPTERQQLLELYATGLRGYTYFER